MTSLGGSELRVVGESHTITELETEVEIAARSNARVLITDESGSATELIARLIHQRSNRAATPFVTVNCADVPESELEAILFGHARDAIARTRPTMAGLCDLAPSGTVLLEEVAEMRPPDATWPPQYGTSRLLETGHDRGRVVGWTEGR